MKITFLGTGASGGTPGTGKSKRLESSILIRNGLNILIDATRDFVQQTKHIKKIDAVLITHNHKDASGGLKYLKPGIPVFAHSNIKSGQSFKLGLFKITPLRVPHSFSPKFPTFAWKLIGSKTVVYASDIAKLTDKFKRICWGIDILIIDGSTWKRKIYSHLRVDKDLPEICKMNVKKIIFTQIGKSVPPHTQFQKEITNICPKAMAAYDGLSIS